MADLRLRAWLTPRFYWAAGIVAFLLAIAPGAHILAPVAFVCATALVAALVADAAIGPRRSAVRVTRVLPEHVTLRKDVAIAYEVDNGSSRPIDLSIEEAPMRVLRFGDRARAVVPPGYRAKPSAIARPVARGTDAFGALFVRFRNTLGLIERRLRVPADATVRVYPDLSAVERYGTLHARNRLLEAGLRRMRMRGIGTEFESLREFADGDAFRSIDWKATARRGKVMVAHREVERSQDVMVLLDCGRLMTARLHDQRKLDYAVTAALSLASIASLASDRVGVIAFARDVLLARAPRSTKSSVRALADALCDVEPRFEEADYARAFAYVRSHLHRRSLVVLLTDVIDPIAQSLVLAELASLARRHVVVCAFMNDEAVTRALEIVPDDADEAYASGVALGLAHERRAAIATLERAGILTLDVPARELSVATIDEYLRIKQRAAI